MVLHEACHMSRNKYSRAAVCHLLQPFVSSVLACTLEFLSPRQAFFCYHQRPEKEEEGNPNVSLLLLHNADMRFLVEGSKQERSTKTDEARLITLTDLVDQYKRPCQVTVTEKVRGCCQLIRCSVSSGNEWGASPGERCRPLPVAVCNCFYVIGSRDMLSAFPPLLSLLKGCLLALVAEDAQCFSV